MSKDIMELLQRLGLKKREGLIYLACLRGRKGLFLHEIVKETRIIRSTADLMVKRLTRRGYLSKIKVGRRWRYSAQPSEVILSRQKQLVNDLEQMVPLLAKMGGERKDMEILYFEGAEGFRQIHEDMLLQTKFAVGVKRDILGFSSGADSIGLFPDMQRRYINKRIKNGIQYKAIAPLSAARVKEWSDDKKALRSVKYLADADYHFRIDSQIYADSVMLYSPTPPIGGVIIRNEKIADSLRSLFYLVWKLLP